MKHTAAIAQVALLASLLFGLASPDVAAADAQVSSRLGVGGGARQRDGGAVVGRFEMLLRAELLFGRDRPDVVRIGPALDLRTANFGTAEIAGGLTLLLPIAKGWPLWLTGGAGYAARDDEPSAAFGLATLAFGFRSYDYHDAYGMAVNAYVTYRGDFEDPSRFDVTAGIAIDLELLFVLPTMAIITWASGGDPD